MRIRSYLALLALSCLIGAYALEQVLAYNFNHVQKLAAQHNNSLLIAKDLQLIESSTSQFLVSTDLVIGSGNTYLIPGAMNIGKYLINELDVILNTNNLQQLSTPLVQSIVHINQIHAMLEQVSNFPPDNLEANLSKILDKYDAESLTLSKNIQSLMREIDQVTDNQALLLEKQKRSMENTSWYSRAVFLILIVALWRWANNRICRPLNGLIKSSHKAIEGAEFKTSGRGPVEIIELSNDFKRLTQTLFHQASHDPLTELQNRRAFERNLDLIMHDKEHSYVLCFIDLDYFKTINDTCGHAAGDEILVSVARILKQNVRNQDIVARLGGDEFAIIIKNCPIEKTLKIAHNIKREVHGLSYQWEDETFQLSASIGVAPKIAEHTTTDLMNSADIACSLAKNAGRNTVHLFDISHENSADKRQDMLSVHQINNAINNDLFVLYKQDIVPLQEQTVGQCFEVLLRMLDSQGNIISPAKFLPIAERYHLSSKIDRWVINALFNHFDVNKNSLDDIAIISVNLSGHSLIDSELEDFIVSTVTKSDIPAEKICFEVTETAAITNIKKARAFIDNIKLLGCKFALDDFGSGHSSYAYIKEFPIDKIKIDGSFICNIIDNPIDFATVKSICEIAKAADQVIIAEFVENEAVVEILKKLGVDYGQGYYFSRPEPLT